MRKIFLFIIIATSLCGVSCKKYLDINNNPNSPTVVGVSPVLPLAIVNAASLTSSLNDYGGQTVGYAANAGGYGGFGASWTYDYPPSQGESYWDVGYSTLENLQYILNNSQGIDSLAYFNAAAKIMKAYVFQMLVDQFNNVPYTNALQGAGDFVPSYDDAATIYPKLTLLIDSAISLIEAAANYPAASAATALTGATDPLFQGNMTSWAQFANSLKLRMIIRAASVVTFSDMTFSSEGFLTTDAVVNPGYQMASTSSGSQVNPSWGTWGSTYAGARVGQAWIPATYVFGYYDGTKLADPGRGAAIFYQFPSNTPTNQLGITPPNNTLTSPSPAGAWYSGGGSGTTLGNAVGVLKGPNMGEPLMLLAESDFLQAEADLRGILSGTAATDFNNGILASFTYLYELPNLSVAPGRGPESETKPLILPITPPVTWRISAWHQHPPNNWKRSSRRNTSPWTSSMVAKPGMNIAGPATRFLQDRRLIIPMVHLRQRSLRQPGRISFPQDCLIPPAKQRPMPAMCPKA